MKIDLLVLKAITEELCDRYVQLNGRYLNTEIDLFWDVPMEQAVDMNHVPEKMNVESLADDHIELEKLVDGNREISICDLDRVANLFKVISFEIERGSEKCMM